MSEQYHAPTPWRVEKTNLQTSGFPFATITSDACDIAYISIDRCWENADHIVTAVNAYDKQRALIETLTAALYECEDYFDNRSDADCDQDGYIPNEEMKRLTTVRDALDAAKKEGFL